MEYTFTLKYQLSANDCNHDELLERLGAADCDDALVGVGQPGRISLEFTREAKNAEAALLSALMDVNRTIPSAKLIEAAPDFVGLTDVAEFAGVTRQNMRKLMVNHSTSFPAPVHEGSSAIWHLASGRCTDLVESQGQLQTGTKNPRGSLNNQTNQPRQRSSATRATNSTRSASARRLELRLQRPRRRPLQAPSIDSGGVQP